MTPRRPAFAVALALLALTGCNGGDGGDRPKVVVQTQFLERLSDAIDKLNGARATLAADGNVLSAAAKALDDVDDVAVDADRAASRTRRVAADKAMGKASPAARALNRHVRDYRAAITALDDAPTTGLDATQQAAIEAVVTAGRDELEHVAAYATVIASVWPRYEKLNEAQKLWLTRYNNGWYRDRQEAAGAYVVMADRKSLARDGRSLANADSRRLAAAKRADTTIAAASGALASLLG